mmetsp:Transcript_10105/g.19504  ORF Transcript_10105/g.19504 Transcript_10105/m.19504 type:complete len:439 (+) Transcript_10105:83-1399(+)
MGANCGVCICSPPGQKALRDSESDYAAMMSIKVPDDRNWRNATADCPASDNAVTLGTAEAPEPMQQQAREESCRNVPVAPLRPENSVVASSTKEGDPPIPLATSGPAVASSSATSCDASGARGSSAGGPSVAPDPLFAQQSVREASPQLSRRGSWRSAKKTDPLAEDVVPLRSARYRSMPSGLRLHKMGSKMLGRAAPESSWDPSGDAKPWQRAAPSGNNNLPQDYRWLEAVLESLARNQAASLECTDTATGKVFVPVFFVLGACPNLFCGMQVVMYSVSGDGEVDFWWVKPRQGATAVEPNTLSRHAKGPYKNDPGRSKPFYKPLADLFVQEQIVGSTRFGIEKAAEFSRAFLEQVSESGVSRQYISLIWQEDWSSNPFTSRKYIKGKIVYQKDPQSLEFFARQYSIVNGSMSILDYEDKPFGSVLPRDDIKELRAE